MFPDEVVAGVRRGDPDAVGAVYVVLADRLLGYLMARVRHRQVAEDLLEATFVELLSKGHTIRGDGPAIKVWLFRSAYFNAMDHLRRAKRRGEQLTDSPEQYDVEDPAPTPEQEAVSADVRRRVQTAMTQLSEDQRSVLLLRYQADLSAPEVAAVLGKSDGAVRSLQHRGERALAKLLEEMRPETVAAAEAAAEAEESQPREAPPRQASAPIRPPRASEG